MSLAEEFPRPCKNCGNPVEMYQGKLVHSYRKREKCNMFRDWSFERDVKGQVKAMHCRGEFPIPDPPTKGQMLQADLDKLAEWNRIYTPATSLEPGESR